MTSPKFYVTTPIYYVNDRPHIGHAYTTVLADVLARYHRMMQVPTYFLTGTDEHGQKVQEAAAASGKDPQQHCDDYVVRFKEMWEKLEITHDDFIRTTEERHRRIVRSILDHLYKQGEIYKAAYEGWYCVPCERFFTAKDLGEAETCPQCERELQTLAEENYFFRMSAYQDWLIDYIENNPDFIKPEHRRQETLGFLRKPLSDLCISRPKSRMSWGIELPFAPDYVTYVWFDALVNYISAVGYGTSPNFFNKWWPADYHLVGKDILTTHTVYWPTMLKAMGLPMPRTVFAHGWWLVGRDKMSKSRGNVVNPMDMVDEFGVDAFRYFVMAEMRLGQDASFTDDIFRERYNADLANNLGNMASRVIKMLRRHAEGNIPACPNDQDAEAEELRKKAVEAVQAMSGYVESLNLDRAISHVMEVLHAGNRYFEHKVPWELAKKGETEKLHAVLYNAAECLRIAAGLLYPVMPQRMFTLRKALGLSDDEAADAVLGHLEQWGALPSGRPVQDSGVLFPRADKKRIQPASGDADASASARPAEKAEGGPAAEKQSEQVDFETFSKIDLRAATVVKAQPVEGADKLLCLQVDLGSGEQRQLVAGIAQSYSPEDITGKTVVIVANLKPARIRGIDSYGMLLAVQSEDDYHVVTVDGEVSPGSAVQ